jgi:hypothetical protein
MNKIIIFIIFCFRRTPFCAGLRSCKNTDCAAAQCQRRGAHEHRRF